MSTQHTTRRLDIRVEDDHLIVSDGCTFHSEQSPVVGARSSSLSLSALGEIINHQRATRAHHASLGTADTLLRCSVSVANVYYHAGLTMDLSCPSCHAHYTLTRDDFQLAHDAYQALTARETHAA